MALWLDLWVLSAAGLCLEGVFTCYVVGLNWTLASLRSSLKKQRAIMVWAGRSEVSAASESVAMVFIATS